MRCATSSRSGGRVCVAILWGSQLRQERLDELIYLSVLNVPDLPGPGASPLASVPYEAPPEDVVVGESSR